VTLDTGAAPVEETHSTLSLPDTLYCAVTSAQLNAVVLVLNVGTGVPLVPSGPLFSFFLLGPPLD
jgi:hypothetical protein